MGKTNPKYFKQIQEYNKEHYKRVVIRFRLDDEEEKNLLEWVNSQPSTNEFIKGLISKAYKGE